MTERSTPAGERIQKVLSRAGVASRRAAERLIRAGRVAVNGTVVTELGTRVTSADELRVDGQLVDPEPTLRYVILNKPPSMLCTMSDPEGRPTVVDLLPDEFGRLYPVGRLDWSSEGLLLLTNNGELANRLLHPRYGVERVYEVKVKGRLAASDSRLAQMQQGVDIGRGEQGRTERAEYISKTGKNTWIRMVLAEGKNREVRRICEALELSVLRLRRVRYGPLLLGDMRPGELRELTVHEARQINALLGQKPSTKPRPPAKAKPSAPSRRAKPSGRARPNRKRPPKRSR